MILIADEDSQSPHQFADAVTSAQYDFKFAKDCASVLLALREEQPDLMVLNAALTDSAEKMIRYVRRTPHVSATGIIVLNADSSPEDRTVCLEAGADVCLPLTVSKRELLAHVRAVLRRLDRLDRRSP